MTHLHGGEIEWAVSEKYGIPISEIISFASTVSPIIPDSIEKLADRLKQLYLYPPRNPQKLKKLITDFEKIGNLNHIILGSGSTELIHLFCEVVCRGGEVIIPIPTYSEYGTAVRRYGGRSVFVKCKDNFELDLLRIRRAISAKTRAIFVCNPNNPTGMLHTKDELTELAQIAKDNHITLFVDEVYLCFAPLSKRFSMASNVESYPVFVLKSLSKLFGVPSLRLGWGIASGGLIRSLEAFKVPGTIGNLELWAGEYLLPDLKYQEHVMELIAKEKKELCRQLSELRALRVFPSNTNFLLMEILDENITSSEVFVKLAEKGLVIRDCSTIRGLNNRFLRVTVRSRDDNLRLLGALRRLLGKPVSPMAAVKPRE